MEFPKWHTVRNLFTCSRISVLLAIIRSDNEHTCKRFLAWDMTLGLVTVYRRTWYVTKEEK